MIDTMISYYCELAFVCNGRQINMLGQIVLALGGIGAVCLFLGFRDGRKA